MPKRTVDLDAPFQRIPEASRITGLAKSDLRAGCKSGRYPHIMRGRDYLLNVSALIAQLEAESRKAVRTEETP